MLCPGSSVHKSASHGRRMQGALTQEYLGSFEEAQHSRRRSGPQNYVATFQDITLGCSVLSRLPDYVDFYQ